jgi:hypothetical protein
MAEPTISVKIAHRAAESRIFLKTVPPEFCLHGKESVFSGIAIGPPPTNGREVLR